MDSHDLYSIRLMQDKETGQALFIAYDKANDMKRTYRRFWVTLTLPDFEMWYNIIQNKNKKAANYFANWYYKFKNALFDDVKKNDFYKEYFDVEVSLE